MKKFCLSLTSYVHIDALHFVNVILSHGASLIQIQKGISSARSDDTKSLKSAIIDWITLPGQFLTPPLARNVKTSRGFNHDCTGFLLCPAGLDWADIESVRSFLFEPLI
jgi:hypothetical protein